jgi:hypothetical protein
MLVAGTVFGKRKNAGKHTTDSRKATMQPRSWRWMQLSNAEPNVFCSALTPNLLALLLILHTIDGSGWVKKYSELEYAKQQGGAGKKPTASASEL